MSYNTVCLLLEFQVLLQQLFQSSLFFLGCSTLIHLVFDQGAEIALRESTFL